MQSACNSTSSHSVSSLVDDAVDEKMCGIVFFISPVPLVPMIPVPTTLHSHSYLIPAVNFPSVPFPSLPFQIGRISV